MSKPMQKNPDDKDSKNSNKKQYHKPKVTSLGNLTSKTLTPTQFTQYIDGPQTYMS